MDNLTYISELVAMRIFTGITTEIRYKLIIIGVTVSSPAHMLV